MKLNGVKVVVQSMVWVASAFRRVAVVYVLSRIAAAALFMWVEGWSFLDAFWWSGVASLTIGYGDMFPETVVGKLIGDGFQMFWVFFIGPAIIAHMVGFVVKNLHMFTHLEQEWLFSAVTRCYELLSLAITLLVAMCTKHGITIPSSAHVSSDGTVEPLPPQPGDCDDSIGGELPQATAPYPT